MVRRFLVGFFHALNQLLQSPQKVVWVCLALVLVNFVIDGSLFRLWSLRRDYRETQMRISSLEQANSKLRNQLKQAKDPSFMEREARDRFDLVSEGDLVFVFSEEEGQ